MIEAALCVLDNAEAKHDIVLSPCEWEGEHICLHNAMPFILWEILLVGFNSRTQIH